MLSVCHQNTNFASWIHCLVTTVNTLDFEGSSGLSQLGSRLDFNKRRAFSTFLANDAQIVFPWLDASHLEARTVPGNINVIALHTDTAGATYRTIIASTGPDTAETNAILGPYDCCGSHYNGKQK